jgi:C1A family cysteine protease
MNKIFLICIFFLFIITITLSSKITKKNNAILINRNKKKQIRENYIINYSEIENLFYGPLPSKFDSSFDWATTNNQYERVCTTPVRNQKVCGCCWACVTTSLIESAYYRHNLSSSIKHDPIVLSTQQIIDCLSANPETESKPSSGCDGGFPIESLEAYLGKVGKNICTEEQYPFVSNNQIGSEDSEFTRWVLQTFGSKTVYDYPGCQQENNCKDNAIWIPQIDVITFNTENLTINKIKKAIYWLGPLYFNCQVPFRFAVQGLLFKNYIYSGELLKDDAEHTMIITGWGTSGKGKNYWIVQNSWGNSWGNNGFVWITQDIDYFKRYVFELAAIKIQRNCIGNENPSANIQIINAYKRTYGKMDDKDDFIFLEFLITAYIPVDNYIESINFTIPGLKEKRAANIEGLTDSDGRVTEADSYDTIIRNSKNYYYNKYGIVAEPTSLDSSKRWFVYRRKISWDDINFEREWSLVIKINNKVQKVFEMSVEIDWAPLIMPLPPPGSIINADITYSI